MLNVNETRMKEIANANVTSQSLLLYFAIRERHTESFNVRVLKNELLRKGIPVNNKDLYSAMERLQKEGLGAIVYGKNGSDDHFKWGYNINQFSRKAFDDTVLDPILKLAPKERKEVLGALSKDFTPVKRKPGRPKGSTKNLGLESEVKEQKRKPGRPKGSKNVMITFTAGNIEITLPKSTLEKALQMSK